MPSDSGPLPHLRGARLATITVLRRPTRVAARAVERSWSPAKAWRGAAGRFRVPPMLESSAIDQPGRSLRVRRRPILAMRESDPGEVVDGNEGFGTRRPARPRGGRGVGLTPAWRCFGGAPPGGRGSARWAWTAGRMRSGNLRLASRAGRPAQGLRLDAAGREVRCRGWMAWAGAGSGARASFPGHRGDGGEGFYRPGRRLGQHRLQRRATVRP